MLKVLVVLEAAELLEEVEEVEGVEEVEELVAKLEVDLLLEALVFDFALRVLAALGALLGLGVEASSNI